MQNGKIDPKMGKTDPDLTIRNSSGLVCKIDNIVVMILNSVFVILSYFTLRFYGVTTSIVEIVLTAVCGKVVATVIQTWELPRIETMNLQVAVFEYRW